jgi:Holliday junction resolvase RusA-like endonuclease
MQRMCLKITKNIFSIDINMQVNLKISLSKKKKKKKRKRKRKRKKERKDTGCILGLKHAWDELRHLG